jgi:hypothetical protein
MDNFPIGDGGKSKQEKELAEQRAKDEKARQEAELKGDLQTAFIEAGGTETEFAEVFPAMRLDFLKAKAVKRASEAREATRRMYTEL